MDILSGYGTDSDDDQRNETAPSASDTDSNLKRKREPASAAADSDVKNLLKAAGVSKQKSNHLIPPQLARPNICTEDIKAWSAGVRK